MGSSLAKITAVAEIKNDGARQAELVKDYIELSPAERDATLIVSSTKEARRELTAARTRPWAGRAGGGNTTRSAEQRNMAML